MTPLRVVHVINQFYAGVGGESSADRPPEVRAGAVGPGTLAARLLGERGEIVGTVVVGDNWAHADPDAAVTTILELIAPLAPDALLLGPAFASGRYGVTLGRLGDAARERLGLRAVVTGMHPENPGVDLFRRRVVIVATTETATGMATALGTMVRVLLALAAGEPLGAPEAEGCLPRGLRANRFHDQTAAERAIAMLLDKMAGRPVVTEIPLPDFSPIPPAEAIADLGRATIAMITTGGVVPRGNPDRIESRRATRWRRYPLGTLTSATAEAWECIHGGFDNHLVNEDPNRVVPLDVLRALEGRVYGALFPDLFTTVGGTMALEQARRFGKDIAQALAAGQVDGAILSVT
jgi:glycine reductase complex component B subunit gamma